MLERLHIRNLRGFSDLRIHKLGRINLVAGRNNAGKTTLLEAVFLLGGAADAHMAVNPYMFRGIDIDNEVPRSETFWKPLFFELDTNRTLTIAGDHSVVGHIEQRITWERPTSTEVFPGKDDGALGAISSGERSLRFRYVDPSAGQIESEVREAGRKVTVVRQDPYVPFPRRMLFPGSGHVNADAILLGHLRRQKRGGVLVDALRVVDPRLQGIEDNSSSGEPMIWVDVGLQELVPLSILGAGMTHVARIFLVIASTPGGVVLVDEIENGLHHSILSDVWRVIAKAAEQFNVQVFATTHSFECVEAAHDALGPEGFRLHRLEVVDGAVRCVTLSPTAIDGAIRHNMEIR